MFSYRKPDTLTNEAYRLFAQLERKLPGLKHLVVTGCAGGEGVTTLAIALAQAAHRLRRAEVLLIDANFRTQGLSALVPAPGGRGLRDFARKDEQTALEALQIRAATNTMESGIGILPRGFAQDVDMVELESVGVLNKVIAGAGAAFGLVIWDTDAINTSPDTKVLLSRLTDVVLVTESDMTRIDHFTSSLNEIATLQARVLAVLRNRSGRRFLGIGADQQ